MDFTLDKAVEALNKGVDEAQEYIKDPSKVDKILMQVEEKLKGIPVVGETIADLPVMIGMVKSWIMKEYTEVSPKVIVCLVGSFLYTIKKKDLIPDSIPVVGYADDLAVLGLALKTCEPELKAYKKWREKKGTTVEKAALAKDAAASEPDSAS